jgi:hypothetical protein
MNNFELQLRLNKIDMALGLLEQVEHKLSRITSEFAEACGNSADVSKFVERNASDSTEEPLDPELEAFSITGLRRLYYTIARLLHPDKNRDKQGNPREDVSELLEKSHKCYKTRDLIKLIMVARGLDIDIHLWITPTDFPLLDYNLLKIQEQIVNKTTSPLWKLGHKSETERKEYAQGFWEKNKT